MDEILTTSPSRVLLSPNDRVQIVGANLSQLDHDFCLMVDVLNVSNIPAQGFLFSVTFYDEFSKALFDGASFNFSAKEVLVQPHEVHYFKPFILDERFHTARQLEIRIQSVTFADKTESQYQLSDQSYYELPMIPLNRLKEMRELIAPDCITYGENLKTSWRCVCGATNLRADFECDNCHRNKYYVLNTLTEPLIDQKIKSILNPTPVEESEAAPLETTSAQSQSINSSQIIRLLRGESLKPFKKRSPGDWAILGLVVTLAIVLTFLGYHQFKTTNLYKNHQLKLADRAIENDDFTQAKTIYLDLSNEPPEDLVSRQEKLDGLIQSKAHFDIGMSSLNLEDPFIALNNFNKVLPEDRDRYSKAHEKIAYLEGLIVRQAKSYIDNNQIDDALDILHRLLNALPNSAEGLNLIDQIFKRDTITPRQKRWLNEIKIKEKEDELRSQPLTSEDKKRAELTDKAAELLHSFQIVTEDVANVRKSPSLDAPILTTIPKNSDIYIYETVIEKTSRIWCQVEIQTPEGIKAQGWISSRVLESPQTKKRP